MPASRPPTLPDPVERKGRSAGTDRQIQCGDSIDLIKPVIGHGRTISVGDRDRPSQNRRHRRERAQHEEQQNAERDQMNRHAEMVRHPPPEGPGHLALLDRSDKHVALPTLWPKEAVEVQSPHEVRVKDHSAKQDSHHRQAGRVGGLEPEIPPRLPKMGRRTKRTGLQSGHKPSHVKLPSGSSV